MKKVRLIDSLPWHEEDKPSVQFRDNDEPPHRSLLGVLWGRGWPWVSLTAIIFLAIFLV